TSDASLFFLQPTTNANVPVSFTVAISYTGINVAGGEESDSDDHSDHAHDSADAGHIHLIIDSPFIEAGEPVPSDDLHIHLLDRAAATELSLAPRRHLLRLQYAGSDRLALEGEQYRAEIVVNVVEGAPEQAVRIASPTSGAI